MDAFLGADLAVIVGSVAHDAAAIDLQRRRAAVRRPTPESFDLGTVDGRENLAQALILRLLTPRGALADLGHAGYGSRLHELLGERKTEALRHLCRAYVLEAVAQEPRVEPKAVALTFDLLAETPSTFAFTVAVQPRAGGEPLALALEVGI